MPQATLKERKMASLASAEPRTLPKPCPNCFKDGVQLFYDVENIPVHSTLQMATPEAAVNYPRAA